MGPGPCILPSAELRLHHILSSRGQWGSKCKVHSGHGVLRTGGKSKGQGEGQAKEQGRGRSGEGRRVPCSRGENPHATDSLPSCLPAEKWRVSSLKRCKDGVGSHSMLSAKTVNHQKWRGRHSWKDNDSGPIRRPRRAGACTWTRFSHYLSDCRPGLSVTRLHGCCRAGLFVVLRKGLWTRHCTEVDVI